MSTLTQMNTWIEPHFIDEIERLADTHGWSRAGAIRVAIATLAAVMSKHEDAPRDADDDVRDLYLRLAREVPGQLVEVSRSVELLRVGEVRAVRAEGWLIWEDQATGDLIAREESGEQRFGRVVDGKVRVMISPAAASLN
jgi:hypothetical protein